MHKSVNPDHIVELCHAGRDQVELNAAAMPLPALGDKAEVPDWIHLLPAGQITSKDGRGPWAYDDPAQLIANSMAETRGMVLDINHATDRLAPSGKEAPAVGWIVELQSRSDGIWGKVDWTEAGRAKVAAREYRFVSPAFKRGAANNKITQILRASLVNNPNLLGMTELNSEADMNLLDKLIAKLGLKEGASEDAVITAIGGLVELNSALPDLAKTVGLTGEATVTELNDAVTKLKTVADAAGKADPAAIAKDATITELNDALTKNTAELTELRGQMARKDAESFVDGAISSGVFGVKSNRDFYIEQHMANPETAKKMIGALPKLESGSTNRIAAPPPADGKVELNSEQTAVARLMGISAADMVKTIEAERAQIELN